MMRAAAPRTPATVGAGLVLAGLAVLACKAGAGDRCICADDCKAGLVCLADGRVLGEDECSPAVGEGANPGECIDEDAAGLGDEGFPEPETFMDLGAKRDFSPGPPPVATDSGTDTAGDAGTTDAEPTGTTAATTSDTDGGTTTTDGGATTTDGGTTTGDDATTSTGTTTATGSTG